jgi:hypothetical protein
VTAHRIGIGARHDPVYLTGQPPAVIDGHRGARTANSASTRASTSGSVIRSVRYTIV